MQGTWRFYTITTWLYGDTYELSTVQTGGFWVQTVNVFYNNGVWTASTESGTPIDITLAVKVA